MNYIIACSLTERCGLSGFVKHICGDILDFSEKDQHYDFVVSWLSILQIPDRYTLFKKCNNILKFEGKMFIEDFYKRSEFEDEEIKVLSKDISCDYLPTSEDYKKQLIESGFTEIKITDKTDSWKKFEEDRENKFIHTRDSQIEMHMRKL